MSFATYTQKNWSLADLFPAAESPEMEAAFAEMETRITEFEALRPQLKPDMPASTLLDILKQLDGLERLGRQIGAFGSLAFAANTQDPVALNFMGRMEQFLAKAQNRVLFFSLWWKDLDDRAAQRLMDAAGPYRYYLEEMRLFKPHTLSEAEEKIINTKNTTGQSALLKLYELITNRYVFKLEVNGEVKELTRGEIMVYARQPDPELRAKAYQEIYRVYGEDSTLLGQMYQTLVHDWRNEQIDLRHFQQPISARNLINAIPDDVVETLLETARKNAGVFQRFFQLKARWLGLERLRRYDVYAPVGAQAEKQYPFDKAVDMVLQSFQAFEPRLAQLAECVFSDDHLDSEVRKGKRGGAFCASINPGHTPYVLVNYQSKADDVATLAHELGHAIHAMLAFHNTVFTFHSSLPLAETASTFGEMMLVDRLLAEEPDAAVRRDTLFRQVDDAYATIMRQSYFALFERQAHKMTQAGASVDDLANAYLENLREQFGDAVEVSDEFRWEWISIPHIYNVPFYVYAYAFGQLLVFSLYRQFKAEGEAFKPRYLKILSAGGSDSVDNILTEAGIDIHSAAFWQGGFDVIRDMVTELEKIPVGA